MKSAYSIFKEIENTSGKNDKIAIIKANSDNSHFTEYLKFLYDDMIVTGLSKKKIEKQVDESYGTYFEDDIEVMNYLRTYNTGRDIDIANVQNFIDSYGRVEYADFLREVFTKSYKCGITSSSVNKAIPSLISTFSCQLAHSYEKHASKVKSTFYLTQKLDGIRALVFVDSENDKITFRTRKGHPIMGMKQIEDDIRKHYLPLINAHVNIVFDGELTAMGVPPQDVFSETTKIVSRKSDKHKTGVRFNVFDYIHYDSFVDGKGNVSYSNRRAGLERLFWNMQNESIYFVNTPILYSGDDKNEIAKWSNWATDNGFEGVMLNIAEGLYETKRTSNLLKVKKFHSADIVCDGVFQGEGALTGTLGGIYVNYKGSKVGVGTGFTLEQRDYYWNNINEIIGRVVEIKYFEESTNQKDDGISLRFPVFVGVRFDKGIEDINYD